MLPLHIFIILLVLLVESAASQYPRYERRPVCKKKIGGDANHDCPFVGGNDWNCLICPNGTDYHCAKNIYGRWMETCAVRKKCGKGTEPQITHTGGIKCVYCQDKERYNAAQETWSNTTSECESKKTNCSKGDKRYPVECKDAYDIKDPNSKYWMNRRCRCSYEDSYIPFGYKFGKDKWTCTDLVDEMGCYYRSCDKTPDGRSQIRGKGYICYVPTTSNYLVPAADPTPSRSVGTVTKYSANTTIISTKGTDSTNSTIAVVDIDNPSGGGNDIGLIVLEVALAIIVIIVIISAVGVVVYCCIQYKKKQERHQMNEERRQGQTGNDEMEIEMATFNRRDAEESSTVTTDNNLISNNSTEDRS